MHLTLPERKETQSNKHLLFRANTKPVGELRCLSPLREDVNSSTCLEERDFQLSSPSNYDYPSSSQSPYDNYPTSISNSQSHTSPIGTESHPKSSTFRKRQSNSLLKSTISIGESIDWSLHNGYKAEQCSLTLPMVRDNSQTPKLTSTTAEKARPQPINSSPVKEPPKHLRKYSSLKFLHNTGTTSNKPSFNDSCSSVSSLSSQPEAPPTARNTSSLESRRWPTDSITTRVNSAISCDGYAHIIKIMACSNNN